MPQTVMQPTSPSGKTIPNQVIITDDDGSTTFQSFGSMIVWIDKYGQVWLSNNWRHTQFLTSKYRAQFLDESTKETQTKLDSGEYKLI